MKTTTLNSLVVAGLLAVTAQTALCQGTIYTSRSAFESALSSSTTITFEDVPYNPSPFGAYSITVSGVTFSCPDALLYAWGGNPHPIPPSGRFLWHFDGGYPVTSLLPAGVTAFGADLSGGIEPNASFNATVTVNLVGGQSYAYNFSAPRGSWTFFGVSFADPIASVVYDDVGHFSIGTHEEMLDNVTFGAIPEPSVLGLFALGGLFVGLRLRRVEPVNSPTTPESLF